MNYSFTVELFLQGIYFLGGFSEDIFPRAFFSGPFFWGTVFQGFFLGGFFSVPAPDMSLFLRKLNMGQNGLATYIVLTSFSGL